MAAPLRAMHLLAACMLAMPIADAFAPGMSSLSNSMFLRGSFAGAATSKQAAFASARSARILLSGRGRTAESALSVRAEEGIRRGTKADVETIKKFVTSENMNPLFLEPENFVIAEDDDGIVGVGQIRTLGKSFELASLVVEEEKRGLGIGTALVTELLETHKQNFVGDQKQPPSVLLLCLKDSAPFYTRLGFTELPLSMAPLPMQMEAGAGGMLARMVKGPGAELTCLKYKFPSVELKCDQSGTMLGGAPD